MDHDGDGVDDRRETTAMSRDADGVDDRRETSSADAIEGERGSERFSRDRNGATAASEGEFGRGREVGHEEEARRN